MKPLHILEALKWVTLLNFRDGVLNSQTQIQGTGADTKITLASPQNSLIYTDFFKKSLSLY